MVLQISSQKSCLGLGQSNGGGIFTCSWSGNLQLQLRLSLTLWPKAAALLLAMSNAMMLLFLSLSLSTWLVGQLRVCEKIFLEWEFAVQTIVKILREICDRKDKTGNDFFTDVPERAAAVQRLLKIKTKCKIPSRVSSRSIKVLTLSKLMVTIYFTLLRDFPCFFEFLSFF